MIKGIASFYNEKSSPNKTVSMLGSVVCPDCEKTGFNLKSNEPCERCHGDSLLTNQLKYNSQLFECAMPQSVMKEHGLRLGDVVKVKLLEELSIYCESSEYELCVYGIIDENNNIVCKYQSVIIVRITDIMAENDKGRIIDLTERSFEELAPIEKGLINVEVEKV